METIYTVVKRILRDIRLFCRHGSGLRLREYQVEVARAVIESVIGRAGRTIVVVFPRQSGKNELQAQIEAYLLTVFSQVDAEMVKVSPTWKPQTTNAMRRLERVVSRNLITRDRWGKEAGYIYKIGQARIFFLSGAPTTNVVGATANLLLECDEAQDVLAAKWDKDFAPMAASTNATRLFWGTTWTSQTLLAREMRAARQAEKLDGIRRVFMISADEVRAEVPAYGKYVDEQAARLGRNHPIIRTQYYSEEIEAEGGMFPPARLALMQGDHPAREGPERDGLYAGLLDVAGEDESRSDQPEAMHNPLAEAAGKRDSTAFTIVQVDLGSMSDELVGSATYRVVKRYLWTGIKHSVLYGQVKALAEHWQIKHLVMDATGVGAGMASFLERALPRKVLPFVFTAKSKSDLGWGFLAVVETGRFKDYVRGDPQDVTRSQGEDRRLQDMFTRQCEYCQSTILDGPGKMMRWGVPDGTRDKQTGEEVHDDLLVSAALCHLLDGLAWGAGDSQVIANRDILDEMREVY